MELDSNGNVSLTKHQSGGDERARDLLFHLDRVTNRDISSRSVLFFFFLSKGKSLPPPSPPPSPPSSLRIGRGGGGGKSPAARRRFPLMPLLGCGRDPIYGRDREGKSEEENVGEGASRARNSRQRKREGKRVRARERQSEKERGRGRGDDIPRAFRPVSVAGRTAIGRARVRRGGDSVRLGTVRYGTVRYAALASLEVSPLRCVARRVRWWDGGGAFSTTEG